MTDTLNLPLDAWHRDKGGRMVPFAGYAMPVQYEGIIAEHLWTREHAGLFDVSHMGQLFVSGVSAAAALESLMPGEFQKLGEERLRYSMLLNDNGGIIDDLMVTRLAYADPSYCGLDESAKAPEGQEYFYVVVNGATKHGDIENMRARLPGHIFLYHDEGRALLALQGPEAAAVLSQFLPEADTLTFMQGRGCTWDHVGERFGVWISRSGYTGEDGFEISVPGDKAAAVADALVADDRVKPIGLGARDSLRLEAGLPLYGHDLDEATTPVMADLIFAINKRRREEGGFAGAARILGELESGAPVKRVGLNIDGRQPVREGALLLDGEGNEVGRVTSGGHSPSLGRPIAMGYVASHLAAPGTSIQAEARGKIFQAEVAAMPFVPHRYYRKQGA